MTHRRVNNDAEPQRSIRKKIQWRSRKFLVEKMDSSIGTSLASMASLPPVPSPWITSTLNGLRVLSPRTWYGLMQVSSRSPFVAFQLEKLQDAALGVLIPIITLVLCVQLIEPRLQAIKLHRMFVLSPWMLHSGWQLMVHWSLFLRNAMGYFRNRNQALPSAIEALKVRIGSKRAYRTHRYDVFLPSTTDSSSFAEKEKQLAVVLLPGALVSHASYAELAGRLSDAGLLVVVPSLEPFLLADTNLGADYNSIRRIMKQVQKQNNTRCLEWTLMGHSMGAFGAMRLYDQFQQKQRNKICNLVLLGVAPFITECTNLSHYDDPTNTRILLIQASDDILMELLNDRVGELYSNFPFETTVRRDIVGGTHHGFASYNDEDGKISRLEQQQQVCDIVHDFLYNQQAKENC